MARILAEAADYLGEARTRGNLVRVDWYPGLIEAKEAPFRVPGDLFRMHVPAQIFPLLDEYEECTNRFPPPHEYRRGIADVRQADRDVSAWAYFYNRPIDGLAPWIA